MKSKLALLMIGVVLVGGGVLAGRFLLRGETELVEEAKPVLEASPVGLANPAAVYCEEQGGSLRYEDDEQGTKGICVLPDGIECGQWDYFRGTCPDETGEEDEVSEANTESAVTALLASKYGKQMGEVNLTVDKNTGEHAQGMVNFEGEIGGGMWYAAKVDGVWVRVF